jgi:hypothetical protein
VAPRTWGVLDGYEEEYEGTSIQSSLERLWREENEEEDEGLLLWRVGGTEGEWCSIVGRREVRARVRRWIWRAREGIVIICGGWYKWKYGDAGRGGT